MMKKPMQKVLLCYQNAGLWNVLMRGTSARDFLVCRHVCLCVVLELEVGSMNTLARSMDDNIGFVNIF
jgi:hypothetical protein